MDEQNIDSSDEFKKMDTEKEHTSFNMPPNTGYSEKKSGASKLLVLILSLIVLVLVGGTFYLFRDRLVGSKDNNKTTPAPTMRSPIVEETPEPTPEPIDRSNFKLRVLNGTKTSGLASDVSSKLKDLGYQIDKTGNATNSAFTSTQVRVKADSSSLLDQLIKDLSPDYTASGSSSLKGSDTVDAEVILGTE